MSDDGRGSGYDELAMRLEGLAKRVRTGFPARATELRAAVIGLGTDEPKARIDLRRAAHKLRGTAGSHGFDTLTDPAARLEASAPSAAIEQVIADARALADQLDALAGPTVLAVAPVDPVSEVRPKETTLAGLRIVAVDDDGSTRKLLQLTLANVGRAQAVVEERGALLVARLGAEPFDVVIVDAMMPEMNGLACLERIVQDGLHREGTRYFVLSAASAQELGWALPPELAVGWLRKPFRPRELVDAIARQLELAR